jgi:uncharacterized protein YqfA (UPF0365 family)
MNIPENPIALVILTTVLTSFLLLLFSGTLTLWLRTVFAKKPVSIVTIIRIKMMGMRAGRIVDGYLTCHAAGIPIKLEELEVLYFASPQTFVDQVKVLIAGRDTKTK